jgi:PAS domain S-box-containing protein
MTLDLQRIFEAVPGCFLVLAVDRPRYTILAVTDAYLRATITQREEIIGRGLFEVFPDNPDDPAATGVSQLAASLERAMERGVADTMAVQKYDIPRPENVGGGFEERYWSPVNIPVRDTDGRFAYIIHRVEDVTDFVQMKQQGAKQEALARALGTRAGEMEVEIYRRAQEIQEVNRQLKQANEQLAQLDQAKTAFFSNVSHEFRTPLTLILGPLEDILADRTESVPVRLREELVRAHRNALRLLKLVNNLLDFSRLEAGRMKAHRMETDLSRATTDLASMFRSAVERAGLTFTVQCEALPLPVYVDGEMWEKIVLNLLSNALKFTFTGGITVDLRKQDDQVVLTVRDTGTGIPSDLLPRVFERFHRIQDARARSFEGSGIGLALVQELVKLHGGEVNVESVQGQGSTFSVHLPLGPAHLPLESTGPARETSGISAKAFVTEAERWLSGGGDAELQALRETPQTIQGHADPGIPERIRSKRVLLADDNQDLRDYVTGLLAPSFRVGGVANGEEALKVARELRPDLILTDVMMPIMDGFALLRAIRSDPVLQATPVILLSARAGEEAKVEGLAQGADDYLVKPFTAGELMARVRSTLELAEFRTELAQHEAIEATLRTNEERLRLALEGASMGQWEWDLRTNRSQWNAREYSLLGLPPGDGTVDTDLFYRHVHPDDAPALQRSIQEALTARTDLSTEFRVIREDGVIRWLAALAGLVYDQAGNPSKMIGVNYDTTEKRQAAEEQRQHEVQLVQGQKLESLGVLVAGVAHNFNNILAVVLGTASMLETDVTSPDALMGLKTIGTACKRGRELVRSLMHYAKPSLGKRVVADLRELLAELRQLLEGTVGSHIRISLEFDSEPSRVMADMGSLSTVFMNICLNSVDAMPQGGELTMRITNHGPDWTEVTVEDTGEGMAPEILARATEPFFTTKPVGKGTGLGLSMAYGVIQGHGGTLSLSSEPGRGTRVKVRLPRLGTQDSAFVAAAFGPGTPPASVLVVDDEEEVRNLLAQMLRKAGVAQVVTAPGGVECLACLRAGTRPDLVILDQNMPGMDGVQTLERIREGFPDLPVLISSGVLDVENRVAFRAPGVAVIPKPFTIEEMLHRLGRMMEPGAN